MRCEWSNPTDLQTRTSSYVLSQIPTSAMIRIFCPESTAVVVSAMVLGDIADGEMCVARYNLRSSILVHTQLQAPAVRSD